MHSSFTGTYGGKIGALSKGVLLYVYLRFVCQGCGWAFGTASKLKRHQQKHTGERKWICPHEDCDKSFMRAEHLKGHLVTHTGEKPFFCSVPGNKHFVSLVIKYNNVTLFQLLYIYLQK